MKSIDLEGLKSIPPKPSSIIEAVNILRDFWYPRHFPALAQYHEDLAMQAVEDIMCDIQNTQHAGRIFAAAKYLALGLLRELRKGCEVSLHSLSSCSSIDGKECEAFTEAAKSQWLERNEEMDKQERFKFAMKYVLPRLRKSDQRFIFCYYEYIQASPSSTLGDFGRSIGLTPAHTAKIRQRVAARVAEAMKLMVT